MKHKFLAATLLIAIPHFCAGIQEEQENILQNPKFTHKAKALLNRGEDIIILKDGTLISGKISQLPEMFCDSEMLYFSPDDLAAACVISKQGKEKLQLISKEGHSYVCDFPGKRIEITQYFPSMSNPTHRVLQEIGAHTIDYILFKYSSNLSWDSILSFHAESSSAFEQELRNFHSKWKPKKKIYSGMDSSPAISQDISKKLDEAATLLAQEKHRANLLTESLIKTENTLALQEEKFKELNEVLMRKCEELNSLQNSHTQSYGTLLYQINQLEKEIENYEKALAIYSQESFEEQQELQASLREWNQQATTAHKKKQELETTVEELGALLRETLEQRNISERKMQSMVKQQAFLSKEKNALQAEANSLREQLAAQAIQTTQSEDNKSVELEISGLHEKLRTQMINSQFSLKELGVGLDLAQKEAQHYKLLAQKTAIALDNSRKKTRLLEEKLNESADLLEKLYNELVLTRASAVQTQQETSDQQLTTTLNDSPEEQDIIINKLERIHSVPLPPPLRSHSVSTGENLNQISMKYYGTPHRWADIYEANLNVISDVNQLTVGDILVIPD